MKAASRNHSPKELGRPSNVGSLVAAVCVGLFALVSNQYARVCAKMVQQMVADWNAAAMEPPAAETTEVSVSEAAEPPSPVKQPTVPFPTAEKIDRALRYITPSIEQMFERWRSNQAGNFARHPSLVELTRIYRSLDQKPELTRRLSTTTRLTLLSVTFMAYHLAPGDFGARYSAWSQTLSQSAEPVERALAEGLSVYVRHNLRRPDVPKLCDDLQQFTVKHQDYGISAKVYVMIAHELWLRGQLKASEKVLKSGMELLNGKPEKQMLGQELMSQQRHLPTVRRKPL